jgi:pimeloyl-ACP methyl ester carboxylesterase
MRCFDHVSGKYYAIDDADIYYEVVGDRRNPPLLFLHGGLGNMEDFNVVISQLSDSFRIIGIDCRGHGKSTLGSRALTYALLQQDVEILLKRLTVDHLSVVGFSNGGTIAYRLAAFSDLKIDKLITIGAPWCTKHLEHLLDAFSNLTSDGWKDQRPSDWQSYMRLNPKPAFDALFTQAKKMALDTSATGRPNTSVQKINSHALLVRGETDPIVSSSDLFELSQLLKSTMILEIPSVGHEAFQDPLFTTQLTKFLKKNHD